jgi:hypothetical protein
MRLSAEAISHRSLMDTVSTGCRYAPGREPNLSDDLSVTLKTPWQSDISYVINFSMFGEITKMGVGTLANRCAAGAAAGLDEPVQS